MGWWFGRILTFEVVADDEIGLGSILTDASDALIEADAAQPVSGYAAYGQSINAAVEPLLECFGLEIFDDGDRLRSPIGTVQSVADGDLGNSADSRGAARIQREQAPASAMPTAMRLGYYDPALDYQAGEARATVGEQSRTEEQRQLPAAISAPDAKSLVQQTIARTWARRDRLILRLPPRYLDLEPGSRINLELSPAQWSVQQCTVDGFAVIAELRPQWSPAAQIAAEPGRIVANVDVVAGDVILALFDVPNPVDQPSSSNRLLLAASTPTRGWKSRSVEIVAGQQIFQAQTARRKTVLGYSLSALPSGTSCLIDNANMLEVELIDPDQWLVSCDDDALANAANLAVLGSELVQFAAAVPLGEKRFRLSRLLRGRGGTEWAMQTHAPGEMFALLERDALRTVALPAWNAASSVTASALNIGSTLSQSSPLTMNGECLRPPAPVALTVVRNDGGDLSATWTRRSRNGWAWLDEVEVPLGEAREEYRVRLSGSLGTIEIETDIPAVQFAAADLPGLGAGAATIEVRQIGDWGASHPAQAELSI